MYAVYHGPDGLRGDRRDACTAGPLGSPPGCAPAASRCCTDAFFDTVTRARARPGRRGRRRRARAPGINLRLVDADQSAIACDETTTATHAGRGAGRLRAWPALPTARPPAGAARPSCAASSDFLTHPVFHTHHSETAMLRYLRRLADRDYALDRGMIPLGSCTMKLNATTEMEPVTWPELRRHPPVRAAAASSTATPR